MTCLLICGYESTEYIKVKNVAHNTMNQKYFMYIERGLSAEFVKVHILQSFF